MADKKNGNGEEKPMFFFLARKENPNSQNVIVYGSERYRMTEYELLSMIKILLVDRRLVSVGRKLLWAYEDSYEGSEKAYDRLKQIGVKMDKEGGQLISKKKSKIYGLI